MFNDFQTRAARMKGLRHRNSIITKITRVLSAKILLQY